MTDDSPDPLDYPRMIAEALRQVPQRALAQVAEQGLPDDHHFYVSFHARAAGVRVPSFLVASGADDETTIVLQNQFWDLVVDEEGFSVTLAFTGARQRLFVPFSAVTGFADPAAELGLRFEPAARPAGAASEQEADGEEAIAAPPAEPSGQGAEKGAGEGGGRGADVVSIDRFRKS